MRGLDYYTKTVFEIISNKIGSQGTVCGGGRYDGLVEQCGGPSMSGVGFGLGLERLLMVMENQNLPMGDDSLCDLYLCAGVEQIGKALEYAAEFRKAGIRTELDHAGRSFKAQFKYADKLKAAYVGVLGEDEIREAKIKIKDMKTGEESLIPMQEAVEEITKRLKENKMGLEA